MEKKRMKIIWNQVLCAGKKCGKRWFSGILAVILAVSGGVVRDPMEAHADQISQEVTSFKTGEAWKDTAGKQIQAHGGLIQKFGDTYYWYGEDKTRGGRPIDGVRAYSSKDLYNWTDEGTVLKVMENREQFEMDEYFKTLYFDYNDAEKDEVYLNLRSSNCIVERPKVLYNEKTGKYVMWFHSDGPEAGKEEDSSASRYSRAMAGVAVSDTPDGPFQYVDSFKLHWVEGYAGVQRRGDSRDMNIFQDEDGSAYIIYSSEMNAYLYIAKLTDDYMGLQTPAGKVTPEVGKSGDGETWQARILPDTSREAPAVFKSGEYYYMITSGTSGWDPNPAKYYRSKDIMAEKWEAMGDPCEGGSKTTFDSQSTYVVPIDPENGFYLYMGDRWKNGDLKNSSYVWLPLIVNDDGTIVIKNYDEWNLEETPRTIMKKSEGLEVYYTTDQGKVPALPEEITVTWLNGQKETAAIVWENLSAADFEQPFSKKNVSGTVKGQKIYTDIEVVPENLVYFVDCGTGSWGPESTDYPEIASKNPGLLNQVSDQEYKDGAEWGYVKTTAAKALVLTPDNASGKAESKYDVGVRTALDYITYKMKLTAGTYQFTAGFHEWWSGQKRTMKPVVTYTDASGAEMSAEGGTFTTSGSDMTVTEEFTIPADGVVSYTLKKTANSAPVLSFLAVGKTKDAQEPDKPEEEKPELVLFASAFMLKGENEASNIKLNWNPIEGAASYRVYRTDEKGENRQLLKETAGIMQDDYGVSEASWYVTEALDESGEILAVSEPAEGTPVKLGGEMKTRSNMAPGSDFVYDSKAVQVFAENGVSYKYSIEKDGETGKKLVEYQALDGVTYDAGRTVLSSKQYEIMGDCKFEGVAQMRKDGKIIIWAHFEPASGYSRAEISCMSGTMGGDDFTFYSERPHGNESRDLNIFNDNGTLYAISAANNNNDLNIYKIDESWTRVLPESEFPAITVCEGQHREAPNMVKVDGWYYLFTSEANGWYPSQGMYCSASTIQGLADAALVPIHVTTFGTQSGWMSSVGDNRLLVGSVWASSGQFGEGKNWTKVFPVSFKDGYAVYNYYPELAYNDDRVMVPVQNGKILSADQPAGIADGDAPGEAGCEAALVTDGRSDDKNVYYKSVESIGVPYSLTVDLGGLCSVSQVDVSFREPKGSDTRNLYKIYGSKDGIIFDEVLVDASSNKNPGFDSRAVENKGLYRYVKITVSEVRDMRHNDNKVSWSRGIHEMTIYGTPSDMKITGYEPEMAVDLGRKPELPAAVTLEYSDGRTMEEPVEWEYVSASELSEPFVKKNVKGTLRNFPDMTISTTLEVIPKELKYFIDCGTGDWGVKSEEFERISSVEGVSLFNDTSDRQFSSSEELTGQWGYSSKTSDTSSLKLTPDNTTGSSASKYEVGLRTNLSSGISYKLYLPAGEYMFSGGYHEWWSNQNRKIQPSVIYEDENGQSHEEKLSVVSLPGLGSDVMSSDIVKVPKDGVVTFQLSAASSTKPVISFLTVTMMTDDNRPAGKVTVSPEPGRYELDVIKPVELTSESEDSIYYTLDGTDPMTGDGSEEAAEGAELYDAPILFEEEGIYEINARSVRNASDGSVIWGPVTTARYNVTESSGPVERYDSVPVGKPWYDNNGEMIQAHGGGFLQMEDEQGAVYYWVGENKDHNGSSFNGINLYSSRDLLNWKFENTVLKPDSENPALRDNKIERPKLIYNKTTGQFILWGHWETADSYASSQICVAVSDTVNGDYTFLGHWRPGGKEKNWRTKSVNGSTIYVKDEEYESAVTNQVTPDGNMSRDMTVYVDGDQGYLVSACADKHSICIYELNDEFTDILPGSEYHVFESDKLEAPAIIKSGDYYYLMGSGQSGWYPNQARYAYTKDISNPEGWSELELIGNNTSFYSQPTNIMELTSPAGQKNYVYMGDRWNSKKLGESTYVWLPLEIDGTDMSLSYIPEWSLNAEDGTVQYEEAVVVSTGKPVTCSVEGQEGYGVEKANDGDYFNTNKSGTSSSYFRPVSLPFTWTVDLEEVYDLSRIDISFNHWNGSEAYHQYHIYGSVDGNRWKQLVDESDNKTTGFKSHGLKGQYRYIKLEVIKAVKDKDGQSAAFAAGLVEVEVFAEAKAETADITGIEITARPFKTTYETGEDFNSEGLEVAAKYSDGTSAKLESGQYELSEVDTLVTGKKDVVVTYTTGEGKVYSDTFYIIVYDPDEMYADKLKVVKQPDRTIYQTGEEYDTAGMEVRILMKASASNAVPTKVKELSSQEYELEYDFGKPGKEKVTVVYYGIGKNGEERKLTDTVLVTVIDGETEYYQTGIAVEKEPDKKVYKIGGSFERTGMIVTRTMKASPSDASPSNVSYTEEIDNYRVEGDDFAEAGKKTVNILYDGTDRDGNDKVFKTSVTVMVTDCTSDVVEAEFETIRSGLCEVLTGENAAFATEEEKQTAAAEAKEKLLGVLEENEGEWILTDEIMNLIESIETYYLMAYTNVRKIIEGPAFLTDGMKITGAGLSANPQSDYQRVEITVSEAETPEGLEEIEGKQANAMMFELAVNGEAVRLAAPVSVSMKVPYGIPEENLKILFVGEDGYTELIRPKVKDGFMVFGVKSFGTLVVFSDTENGGGEVDEKTLDHIAVTKKPVKTEYRTGEEFEPEGMVVTAYYSDGTKEVLTEYEVSGFDSGKTGTQMITVTYKGKTAEFEVTVRKRQSSYGGSGSGSSSWGVSAAVPNVPGTWKQDEKGWWYEKKAGGYLKAEWGRINGTWYYFNEEGYMETGWVQTGGQWYFLNADGSMVENNWVLSGDQWYYLKNGGSMAAGQWVTWKEKSYYLNQDGTMAMNTVTPDGYRVDKNGVWIQ